MKPFKAHVFTSIVVILITLSGAIAQEVSTVLTETGVKAGLAVHLGTTDGAFEIALGTGSFLVHGLASQNSELNAVRMAIMGKGLYGLVSVEKTLSWTHLPYGDRQVNLLVADMDILSGKGLTQSEVDRVMVPGGAAYLKNGGVWKVRRAAWPTRLGSTTNWFANPQGTSVTNDLEMRPPTTMKWIANHAEMDRMRYATPTGLRIESGRAYYEYKTEPMIDNGPTKMVGRDAFNGVLLWEQDGAAKEFNFVQKTQRFVAVNGTVFCFPRDGDYAAALDGATGRQLLAYTGGLKLVAREKVRNQELTVAAGKLIQTGLNRLVVLNEKSGERVWQHAETDTSLWVGRPVVDTVGDRVFCLVSYTYLGGGRWAVSDVKSLLCFKLSTGELKWRSDTLDRKFTFTWYKDETITPVETRYRIGQLAYHNGTLAFFNPEPLGASQVQNGSYRILFAGAFNADDGKLLWVRSFQDYAYTMVVRNDSMYLATGSNMHALPIRTGAIETIAGRAGKPQFKASYASTGYNGRCNRMTATPNWFIQGLVTYWDRSLNWVYSPVNRSSCATGAFPAHGMVYFTPNGCYGCIKTTLRGYQALRFEPMAEPVPDSRRIETGSALPPISKATQSFAATGAVVLDFTNTNARFYGTTTTAPVMAGDLTLIAKVNEHRLEARRGSELVWSVVAGGRILTAPKIYNDETAIFGATDGWVYAVKTTDGSLLWRFMAAPYEKKMVAYGQLESAWPVYGVSFHNGNVCFSAGRHPDLDGGIAVYALDPRSGSLVWKRRYSTTVEQFESVDRVNSKYTFGIDFNRVLNDTLVAALGFDPSNPVDIINRSITPSTSTGKISLKGTPVPLLEIPATAIHGRSSGEGSFSRSRSRHAQLAASRDKAGRITVGAYFPGHYRLLIVDMNGRALYKCACTGMTTHRLESVYSLGRFHIVLIDEETGSVATARAMTLR